MTSDANAHHVPRTVRARATATRTLCALLGVALACSGTARAHGGEPTGVHDAPLAIGLFAGGVVLLGTGVYLDATREVRRSLVDASVFVGVAGALVGLLLYWA